MMPKWLNNDLKNEISKIFEPKYKRKLSNSEIAEIAENLTEIIEIFLKVKWREKYGNLYTRS